MVLDAADSTSLPGPLRGVETWPRPHAEISSSSSRHMPPASLPLPTRAFTAFPTWPGCPIQVPSGENAHGGGPCCLKTGALLPSGPADQYAWRSGLLTPTSVCSSGPRLPLLTGSNVCQWGAQRAPTKGGGGGEGGREKATATASLAHREYGSSRTGVLFAPGASPEVLLLTTCVSRLGVSTGTRYVIHTLARKQAQAHICTGVYGIYT